MQPSKMICPNGKPLSSLPLTNSTDAAVTALEIFVVLSKQENSQEKLSKIEVHLLDK